MIKTGFVLNNAVSAIEEIFRGIVVQREFSNNHSDKLYFVQLKMSPFLPQLWHHRCHFAAHATPIPVYSTLTDKQD